MASEPIHQPMLFHMTFVRVTELPWPHDGFVFRAECRACEWTGYHERMDYTVAARDGQVHQTDYS